MRWLKEIWNWLTGPETGRSSAEIVPSAADEERARSAGWRDVFRLVESLEKHGAEYVLVGGYALSFNGLARQTGDVDILVPTTPENNRRWIAALSELPDGAAKELFEIADDPFTVSDAAAPSGPGVIRVIDEFVVDVLPAACGLTYDELKPHVRRTSTQWGPINVLDLEGLRLTKQSPRGKDRVDLQHIEAALRTIRGRVSERVAAMSRRDFVAETPPADDSIEFKVEQLSAPSPDLKTRPLAKAIVDRALARGIALDEAFEDRLSIYGDAASLGKMLEAADRITDFHAYASEIGIEDPKSRP
jgi:hypothetical protein